MSQQVKLNFFYLPHHNLFNIICNSSDLDVIIKDNAIYMVSVYAMTVGWALIVLGGSVPQLQG